MQALECSRATVYNMKLEFSIIGSKRVIAHLGIATAFEGGLGLAVGGPRYDS
jgi:hypothetical protein